MYSTSLSSSLLLEIFESNIFNNLISGPFIKKLFKLYIF